MAFTQDFRTQRRNYEDGDTRIGEKDRLWYDSITNTIRISDGETPGGIAVSGGSGGGSNYTLPTATTTVKGGVKIDGTTIAIDGQVISVGTVPYNKISGAPTVPTTVSQLTNDTGFITGVSWTQVTGKPILFSGAYADLSGKPTAVSAFTNDSGYLTSSSLSSYATQSYVTSRGYVTSASIPTAVSQLSNDSEYLTDNEFDLNTINYDSNNNLHATGILPGDADGFTAVFAGRAAGIAALPNTVIQSQAQVNDYAQNNFQNTNDGNHASTEWVATSPNGDDSNYYIDLGINGASWDGTAENSLYDNVGQRDGWLYVQGGNAGGGNLVLGTSIANTYTKIIAGDVSTGDREVARFASTGITFKQSLTFNDNTTQSTAWLGTYSYDDLTDTPTLVTSYNDLTDLPSLFSGAYADLTGKPTLVTSYNDLTDLPTLVTSYNDLTDLPSLFSGSYNDLTNKPTLTTSLSALTDVNIAGAITGQVLTYDSITQRWIPGGAGGGATGALGYYGSFYDVSATQLNSSAVNVVSLGGVYGSNGVTIQDGSKITFSYAGTYSVTFSLQFVNDNAVEKDVSVWLKTTVGGITSNVADSTVVYTVDADTGSLGKLVAINPFILTVEAGEQIQIYWQAASSDVYLKTIDAQTSPSVPRAPAVILIIEQTSSIIVPDSIAGNAATVTNGVYTTDTGTVTNAMLAGSIANNKLANSSLTVNGTSISLGASGTITANTTNALTIGTGLKGTATTFNGSAANTVSLDTTVTTITATAGATTTLDAATLTPHYNITGTISGTHVIRLPDLTTLAAGTKITFNTAQGTLSFQLSTGTVIVSTAVALSRQIIFTVLSNAANTTANVYYTQTGLGMTGTGNNIVTSTSPVIVGAYITGLDSTTSTFAYASTPILTLGATSNAFTQTLNIGTAAYVATYTKTLNIGTGLAGGTSVINIGTGVASGTATMNLGSATTTTTMNGAVTITSLTATNSIVGSITGNAATATKLGTARAINGTNFDGSAAITITAANPNALTIGTGLTGTSYDGSTGVTVALDSTVALRADTTYIGTTSIALNRTSASQTLTGVSIDGNAATVTNGVYTSGTYTNPTWISSLAYSKLTGTPTLFSGAYADLTGKPTIYSSAYIGTTNLDFTRASGSQTLTGVSIDGNAATVTNGLYSTSSYANPAWITSLAYSKLTGAPTVPTNVSQLTNDSSYATLTGIETLTNKTLTLPTIGGTGATFNGSTSGTTVLKATATAGTTTITLPATTGTVVTTGDTGTVTNAMLAGSIANAKLANSTISGVSLGSNLNALTIGTGLSGTSYNGSGAVTIAIDSTVATLTGSQTLTSKNINGTNNTITNIANSSLTNSSVTVGTTAISLGSSSTTLGGMAWITFAGSTSGTTQLRPSAIAGSTTVTMPGTTGTLITTGDTGTVTNAMLAGSIANSKLANSAVTVNGTSISLGASATVTAAADTLTGTTLNSSVVTSSLTSVGTLNGLTVAKSTSGIALSISAEPYTPVGTQTWTFRTATGLGIPYSSWINFPDGTNQTTAWTGTVAYSSVTGTPTLATVATSGSYTDLSNKPTIPTTVTVNGTAITLGSSGTVTADANTLTGTELKSTVVTSSLTSVGTLTGLTSSGAVSITNNTNSSSTTTGALKVTGGVGIGGKLYVGDTVSAGAIDATNITASGTLKANNGILGTTQTTAYVFNDTATTVNIGGSASTISLGYSGTLTIGNSTVVGTQTTVNLWNTTSTTVNFAGAATTLNLGASTGTTTVNNNLSMASGKTIGTTGSITSNNATAFIAGDNAISGVALQIPTEGAIRNLTNGATNMYFDVSIGGSTNGQFLFRSSSSFTSVLTMSPTAFNVNTGATVTARTPSLARLAWNSAIDTELTVDELRFRISNQGGIFPQVISNTSGSKNLGWTAVGCISGGAITQVGNTGIIVANNVWATLYNSRGMDNPADNVVVTLQDKAQGRIYRVTFIRSDNGSTTGYNIIAERLL